jgi:hypothetical protein
VTTPVTGAELGPATWTMTSTAAAATYSAALETVAAPQPMNERGLGI